MSDKTIPLIRSTHQYSFRSGEWARIVGVEVVSSRCCFVVEFIDGKRDSWVIEDAAAGYEFRPTLEEMS